jgi:hypothetical protein
MSEPVSQARRAKRPAPSRPWREIFIGVGSNVLFLLCCCGVYNTILIECVRKYDWAAFFGEFWFFALEMLFLPLVFAALGKRLRALGALTAIVVWVFIFIPLAFMVFGC